MRLRLLILAALMAAVTAVCSLLAIPNPLIPTVPFTLQVFAVCLAGMLLPPGWALAAEAVYLFLGAIGMPVFAGASAGAGVLFSVSGGFLWGYPFAAALCAVVVGRGAAGYWRQAAGGLVAVAVIYAFGLGGMVGFGHLPADAATILALGSFLPWDVLKALLAALITLRVRAAMLRGSPA